jgi:hypothetical protein
VCQPQIYHVVSSVNILILAPNSKNERSWKESVYREVCEKCHETNTLTESMYCILLKLWIMLQGATLHLNIAALVFTAQVR